MKTMSEPSRAWAIFSLSSSAARSPIEGSPPAPRPRVSLSPMRSLCGASDWRSAWASVLRAMNSTPIISARIIRLTALLPPPPTPTTLIEGEVLRVRAQAHRYSSDRPHGAALWGLKNWAPARSLAAFSRPQVPRSLPSAPAGRASKSTDGAGNGASGASGDRARSPVARRRRSCRRAVGRHRPAASRCGTPAAASRRGRAASTCGDGRQPGVAQTRSRGRRLAGRRRRVDGSASRSSPTVPDGPSTCRLEHGRPPDGRLAWLERRRRHGSARTARRPSPRTRCRGVSARWTAIGTSLLAAAGEGGTGARCIDVDRPDEPP